MKKILITLATSVSLMVITNVSSYAGESNLEMKAKILKTLIKNGPTKFCRKGNAFAGVFSIRSFEGRACSVPQIAALALKICSKNNVEDFNNSACARIAKQTLGTKDQDTVIADGVNSDPEFNAMVKIVDPASKE